MSTPNIERISPRTAAHAYEHSVKSHVVDYWAQRAEDFSELHGREFTSPKHDAWLAEVVPLLPTIGAAGPLRILDAGTGSGFLALLLAELGHDVTGIDLTPEMIAHARAASAELGIPVSFEVRDAENTGFDEGSFDVIVTRNLTWTLPHLAQAYRHWYGLLADGGVLINLDGDYTHERRLDKLDVPAEHVHKNMDMGLVFEYEHIKEHLVKEQLPRPEWDLELLEEAGFTGVVLDSGLSERLFKDVDVFYNPTPMFRIVAHKDLGAARLKDDNISYWTGRAEGYSAVNEDELAGGQREVWTRELTEQIGRAFPNRTRDEIRVLEVGCGPGFFSIILTEAGYRVTATDYTAAMLAKARDNAGDLAEKIDFRLMDAEALELPDASYDVVVARNVTWNLPHPDVAYGEWMRVLAPGGVLLSYDANWYNHLFDAEKRAEYEADRAATSAAGIKDEYAGTDIDAMEDIARQMPLSPLVRPQWDAEVLGGMGLSQVETDADAWRRVFSAEERVNYASTPMFLVRAVK